MKGTSIKAPPLVPASLPRPGKRTLLGCAYLYIEAALVEATPVVRGEIAKDLKAYIDLIITAAPSITGDE